MSDAKNRLNKDLSRIRDKNWGSYRALPELPPIGRPASGLVTLLESLTVPADQVRTIVEVGVEMGGSTRCFLDFFPNATIICIDPWVENYPLPAAWQYLHQYTEPESGSLYNLFLHFMRPHRDRVIPFRGYSQEMLGKLSYLVKDVDLIYIDGDHRYHGVFADLTLSSFLWPNALVTGDDWEFEAKAAKYKGIRFPVRSAATDFAEHFGYSLATNENSYLLTR